MSLRVLPSVREIVGGRVTARDLRDLRIEDLLGRQQVETDLAPVRQLLRGRRVLITGAGGSIGSEIARQVRDFEPASSRAPRQRRDPSARPHGDARRRADDLDPGRRPRPRAGARGVPRASAAGGVPRGRSQARADPGGASAGGAPDERPRDGERRGGRHAHRRGAVRPDLDRQGGAADERDGRLQADGRGDRPQPAGSGNGPVRGSVRQRPRQPRVGRAHVPAPDRGRGTGDGDRPGDDPLLHERGGGGAARAAGRRAGARRRGVHARDGRAGEHPRPGEPADPALGARARSRHRGPGDRRAPGREAARGAGGRRRGRRSPPATRGSWWRRRRRPDPASLRRCLREMETARQRGSPSRARRLPAARRDATSCAIPAVVEEAS